MQAVFTPQATAAARPLRTQATRRMRASVPVSALAQHKSVGLSSLRVARSLPAGHVQLALQRAVKKRSPNVVVRAASNDGSQEDFVVKYGSNVILGLTWAALVGYAFLYSPNQTPIRDQYFLEKLVGLGVDNVPVNQVFAALFNAMGLWPAMYSALIIPTGKSENGVPAWPFLTGSFALGAFMLIPYMALWQAPTEDVEIPTQEELKARGNGALFERLLEGQFTGIFVLVASLGLSTWAISAGPTAWESYGQLFKESRFVHVTSVDFITCSLLAPFWIWNDAQARRWDSPLLPVCLAVPFVGPALYLAARPRRQ